MALSTPSNTYQAQQRSYYGSGGAFEGLPNAVKSRSLSRDDLMREIERMGYSVGPQSGEVGPPVVRSDTGFPGRGNTTSIPLDRFVRDFFGRNQPTLLDQLTAALGQDINAQESAIERQRGRIDRAENLLLDSATSGADSITKQGEDYFDFLTTEARRRTTENLGRVEDLRAQTSSDATGAIFEQIDQAKQELLANPSLSEGERQARLRDLDAQGRRASQAALTQIANDYSNRLSNVGVAMAGQEAETDRFAAQLASAARISAFNAKLSGATTYANFILQSPESIVSRLAGLSAIAQIKTAPGGGSLSGLRFA